MINVIPMPKTVREKDGVVILKEGTTVYFAAELMSAAKFFDEAFGNAAAFKIARKDKDDASIAFIYSEKVGKEGYALDVNGKQVRVTASTHTGALYAIETLKQLFGLYTTKNAATLTSPVTYIEDEPRYAWRAVLLDVARHFFPVAEVKRFMDNMLMHKLNVLHLHLTDDQGWRIEIKKYPLLTEIGSVRDKDHIHGWGSSDPEKDIDPTPQTGYFTQEDIKELVAYGEERGIMIVPEIDMPAHFRAAMAAYPWLGCDENIKRNVPFYYGGKFAKYDCGDEKDVLRIACGGKETTYEFIKDVIGEICDIFPAPYVHIGGDEAPKDEWKKCPHCQERMKKEGLKDEEELQAYLNNRVSEQLKARGKRLIVWNEALRGGNLDVSTIGQYWTPLRDRNAEKYVNERGGELIMSKHQCFYFDMCYGQVPLQNTYNFDSGKWNIMPEGEKNIMGVEGTLWSEWIRDRKKLDFSSFPRLAALAEVGWTPAAKKDFKDFMRRLQSMKKIYSAQGITYAADSIAACKNPIKRLKERKIWYTNNQHHELEMNDAALAKENR